MNIDDMSELAMGLAMYDTYKTAMERNRERSAALGSTLAGMQPGSAYHILVDNLQRGPYSLGQMQEMIAAGTLSADTYVWKQGSPDWQPAGELPEFAGRFGKNEQSKE